MTKMKKLKLVKFECKIKESQMNHLVAGVKSDTSSYGHKTLDSNSDRDSSNGDWDGRLIFDFI